MWEHSMYCVCALFPVQGGMWTAVHIPPCTGNNAHTTHNMLPHRSQ